MEEESEEEVGEGEEEEDGGGGRGGEDEQKGQKPLGCLSESLGISFGSPLEASWGVLGPLGGPRGFMERFGCLGGASWGLLWASWKPLGGILGDSWRPLGASWAPPGAILDAIDQKEGGFF